MNIPKKIDPCPIIEAIIEIRIDTKVPGEAILGVVYNEFKKDFPHVEKLPILQIPEQFRSSDPNLMYKPYYQLKNERTLIQVGSKVISLVNVEEYLGWPDFSDRIYNVFERLFKSFEIEKIHRVAARYVNLFKDINIFNKMNLEIQLSGDDFSKHEINFVANVESKSCRSRLSIANKAQVVVNKKTYKGSVVDIDTVTKDCPKNVHENMVTFRDCIEKAHLEEKELFFQLLRQDYIDTLNPEF
jgi:uncharacterized protein (TIGR04255 family)